MNGCTSNMGRQACRLKFGAFVIRVRPVHMNGRTDIFLHLHILLFEGMFLMT
jgi:hypothetical protein